MGSNRDPVTTAFWTDRSEALGWAANDAQRDLLRLPRVIAAEIVAIDRPQTSLVADLGSGPGDFLGVFLHRFPDARGIWSDISPAMEELGRAQLAPFLGPDERWNTRLREARKRLVPRTGEQQPHHHNYPLTSVADHRSALAAADLTDVDTPWRGFVSALFMARRDG